MKQHYYPQASSLHAAVCKCVRACVHLASAGVQVVAVGGEEQMGEASVVAGRQQSQQGAVLAGVEASAAGVRATGINRLAGAEAKAGDDATLALFLHCSEDKRVAFGRTFGLFKKVHKTPNHFYLKLTFGSSYHDYISERKIFLNNAHINSHFDHLFLFTFFFFCFPNHLLSRSLRNRLLARFWHR